MAFWTLPIYFIVHSLLPFILRLPFIFSAHSISKFIFHNREHLTLMQFSSLFLNFVAGKEFWQKTSKRSKESRVAIIDAEAKETQEFFCFLNDLGNVVTKTRQADERNVRKEVVNGCDMNDIEVCILYGICAICAMYSFKVGHLQASVFHFPPTLK